MFSQFVFIGVNQIGVGMVLKPFHVLKKRIRFEEIIVIEEGYPITLRERETAI